MKIKRNTPDLLIAGETPWFIAIMLMFFTLTFVGVGMALLTQTWAALIFIFVGGGLGLGAMSVFVERLQMIMDASAGTLTLRSRTILRYKQTVIPLEDVIRADTETGYSNSRNGSGSRQKLSRLAFIIRDGSGTGDTTVLPMTPVMSSGGAAGQVTREVNAWLKALRGVDRLTSPATEGA